MYKRICNNCKKHYIGHGKMYCSLSCIWKNRKHSKETKEKMSSTLNKGHFQHGMVSPMKGKRSPYSGQLHHMYGIKRSKKTRQKISHTRIIKQIGRKENNGNWKGGITEIKILIRSSIKYAQQRKEVFRRDMYTCQSCGDNNGGNLEMHHKKPFSVIFKENEFKSFEDSLLCHELWDNNNCITLCHECHKSTDTYGRPKNKVAINK